MKSMGVLAAALVALLAGCQTPQAVVKPPEKVPEATPPGPPDPLVTLNQSFRDEYKRAKADALARSGPVLLSSGDSLILLRNGQREEAQIRPPLYHQLKAVAHIPLAIYVLLAQDVDAPLSPERLQTLTHYRDLLTAARNSLTDRGLSAAQLERQQHLFAESAALLESVVVQRRINRDDLTSYLDRIRAPLLANITDATNAELDRLSAQVNTWRKKLTSDEWSRLHVVIIGAHMAREDEVSFLYFSRLLGEPYEGHRIIFAESQWEEPKALDLFATHLVDGDVGQAFFGDPMRMHRDALSDAARAYLDAHPVQP